jgi:hypothetical protein
MSSELEDDDSEPADEDEDGVEDEVGDEDDPVSPVLF